MRRALVVIAVAAILWSSGRPFAWGASGHHIVARIALARMTPNARSAATAILGAEDFVTVSTWADEVRQARPETYNWHFVDIPFSDSKYDAARDCPATDKGDCVIAEISRAQHVLRDTGADAHQRSEALKFLIHFVGDLHQPLHAIDNHDRGGNDVKIPGDAGRTTNLHAMWDSGIIQQRGLNEDAYVAYLLEDLKAHPLPASDDGVDPIRWAEESHKVAVADVYHYPEFVVGANPPAPINLDVAYMTKAKADVDRQLELGGAHLAALLNQALGGR